MSGTHRADHRVRRGAPLAPAAWKFWIADFGLQIELGVCNQNSAINFSNLLALPSDLERPWPIRNPQSEIRNLLVGTEGIEPPSPLCKGGILPLNEAPNFVLVAGDGIEPSLRPYESRQTARPSHPLPFPEP